MNKLKNIFLGVFLLFPLLFFAQQTVSGKITDNVTKSPLLGVNVVVKGTTNGSISDFDGLYEIRNVNMGDILVFTSIGYNTRELKVTSSTLDVEMVESTEALDEVVVIGYGTTTVKDATGSIEKVSTDEFNSGAITSPEQLITGKTAGVSVVAPGGQPGQGATITIRGNSSLSANNSPLVVIDGVPVDQGTTGGSSVSALNSINPNDIESFVVLKDASSTAIYGSRASAGVILITTKSGKLNAPLKVEVNTNGSVGTVQKKLDVLNASQYKNVLVGSQNEALAVPLLGNANTDWQDQIFQEAYGTDANLTISKGFESSAIRGSIGYTTQEGLVKTSKFERTSGSLNFRQNLFDNDLKINVNLNGSITNDDFVNGGVIGAALQFDPTQPIYSGNNNYGGYYEWLNNDGSINNLAPRNPLGLIHQSSNEAETKRAIGNVKLDYYAPFLDGLNFNVTLGFDYNERYGKTSTDPNSASAQNAQSITGSYGSLRRSTLADFFVNYKKEVESIKSTFELTVGHTFQKFYRENYANNPLISGTENSTFFATHNAIESYVSRLRYSYDSKYLLTLSYRTDGSSRFSGDNRWGNFSAAAFAWNISEENFLKDSETISNLKLRIGYGETGQQEINQDFGYLPVYQVSTDNQQYQLGDTFYNTIRPAGYDANIKWEESKTYNIGLDYGFLNNRINGSIEYYTRESNDILNQIPIPSGSNLTNQLITNIGDLENSGFEFSINSDIIQREDFNWNLGFNLSYLTNKITKLNTVDDPSFIGVATGGISGGVGNTVQIHQVGSAQSSFLVYQQVYDADGKPLEGVYVDMDGDGVSGGSSDTGDLYVKENPSADYLLGFSSYTNYKNWDLNFTMRASIGNYVYNNVASSTGNEFGLNSLSSNRNVSTSILDTEFKNNQLLSDYYIQDASFLKMDNVTLGYNFKNAFKDDKVSLRIQTTVQNVFTITNYDGIDPEISGGIDNNFYPRPRTFLLGLNLKF
ncbi:SusC/RagA family TonB-linked outer membrane protein [Cellulophaga lytica]|uniref:SusC/RagA family TonB-linked outer membrane protein n=1 Tax=Cellulophaga lytica TaxID=979 RepID=UPI0026E12FA7|nr:SusC/RagA family TonB-linked outer membrane protein [Cellulophaga lytica]MDO6855110.1 SusC/RagA family TonB-linked outer membrane protein [Cellulophaga lytica]